MGLTSEISPAGQQLATSNWQSMLFQQHRTHRFWFFSDKEQPRPYNWVQLLCVPVYLLVPVMSLENLAQRLDRDDNVDPWDTYVRPSFDKLVKQLEPTRFMSSLYKRGLVSRSDQQRLKAEPTSESQVQMLLMEILPYHLPWWSTFEAFCDVLAGTEGQSDVLVRLINPPGLRLKTQGE